MTTDEILRAATGNLRNARSDKEPGGSIHSVCESIYTAMNWAIEYWIRQQGEKPDVGNDWQSMCTQFVGLSAGQKIQGMSSCRTIAMLLELQYEGGMHWDKQGPLDVEKWQCEVEECLVKAEQMMELLLEVYPPSKC